MGTDEPPNGGSPRGSFLPAALWSMLLGALAQGAHLTVNADGLSAFAPFAYVGLLAPLLVLAAIALTLVARSAAAQGWLDASVDLNHERLLDWAWRDDVVVLARRSAAICAAAIAVAAFSGASWVLGRAILDAVARPGMGLGLLVGLQLTIALLALGVFVVAYGPLASLLTRVGRRALVAPASLAAAVLALAAIGAIAMRTLTDVGEHLPWDLLTAALFGATGWLVVRRARRAVLAAALAVTVLVGCLLSAVWLPQSRRDDRAIFTDSSPVTSALYRPIHRALDRDGDGSIHLFGGGDCAPDDPEIHPEALEKLNNGIDEDCSGADFTDDVRFDEAARSFPEVSQLKSKPNVVLITTDSLSLDRTSLGREDRDTTPQLAAWAQRGALVYDHAFALGPSTRLAFPGIMASQFNSTIELEKTRGHPYDWSVKTPTIARALAATGYRTVMVTPDPYFATRWKNGPSRAFDVHDHSATKKPADRVHTAPEVTAAALKQLEAGAKDTRPIFMWVHYYDHHSPFRRPKGSKDFGSETADIYDSEVEFADRYWGKLFSGIDRILEGQDTIVIFTSDHGESFDRYHPKKHHGHDLRTPVLHVPLIISAPEAAHRRVPGLVTHADIAPTIADLTRTRRDGSWIGESLAPTLWGPANPTKTVAFGLYYLPERHETADAFSKISVRTDDWYYERNLRDGAERLTNWRADPSGERDLTVKQRETAAVLRQVALQKLDALKRTERGLSKSE